MMATDAASAQRGAGAIRRLRSAETKRLAGGRIGLRWQPVEPYRGVLARAFPEWADALRNAPGSAIVPAGDIAALRELLRLLRRHPWIDTTLTECYALDMNRTRPVRGPPPPDLALYRPSERFTRLGTLLRRAKGYDGTPINRRLGDLLAAECVAFVRRQPTLRRADVILPVPPSQSRGKYCLPAYLAARMAAELGIEARGDRLQRSPTAVTLRPMKERTSREKWDIASGLLEADSAVAGARVLLLDDLQQSGATLFAAGEALREAGAAEVYGLTVVKTWPDEPTRWPPPRGALCGAR